MSNEPANSLSREKIQQLLAAVGSGPKEDTTQMEAADYDWQQPHYFSSEQLKRLDDLAKEAAKEIAEKCSESRMVCVLEGGYNLEALAASVEAHIRILME